MAQAISFLADGSKTDPATAAIGFPKEARACGATALRCHPCGAQAFWLLNKEKNHDAR
jgi:hypothetical protein